MRHNKRRSVFSKRYIVYIVVFSSLDDMANRYTQVYEKKNAENSSSSSDAAPEGDKEKKD